MKIGVIGKGFVGTAIQKGFESQGHYVISHDVRLETSIRDVISAPIVYICVPTPSKDTGECNTDIVESVIRELYALGYKGKVCVKSTVKPGSIDKWISEYTSLFTISYVPEFLRERCSIEDFLYNQNVLVIGINDSQAEELIKECHGTLPTHTVTMKPIEAELMKYFSNSYKAMRVTFANSFYKLCEELNANYDVIRNGFLFHGIGEGDYLKVNDKYRGFGGSCLPKDTKGLAKLVEELNLDINIFKTIIEENEKFKDG